jgi:hypothetical protein
LQFAQIWHAHWNLIKLGVRKRNLGGTKDILCIKKVDNNVENLSALPKNEKKGPICTELCHKRKQAYISRKKKFINSKLALNE